MNQAQPGAVTTTDQTLDASGLNCPMPLLKAKQAINGMQAGQTLQVIATDAGSWRDFKVWCEQSGHRLLSRTEQDDRYIYILQKN